MRAAAVATLPHDKMLGDGALVVAVLKGNPAYGTGGTYS